MAHKHTSFWLDLTGRIGAPILAATIVACILQGKLEVMHIVLASIGLGLIVVHHWAVYHKS